MKKFAMSLNIIKQHRLPFVGVNVAFYVFKDEKISFFCSKL